MKCSMCNKEPAKEYEEDGIKVALCSSCSEMVNGIIRNSDFICNDSEEVFGA